MLLDKNQAAKSGMIRDLIFVNTSEEVSQKEIFTKMLMSDKRLLAAARVDFFNVISVLFDFNLKFS